MLHLNWLEADCLWKYKNLHKNNILRKLKFNIVEWKFIKMPTSFHLAQKSKAVRPCVDVISLNEKSAKDVDGLIRNQRFKVRLPVPAGQLRVMFHIGDA